MINKIKVCQTCNLLHNSDIHEICVSCGNKLIEKEIIYIAGPMSGYENHNFENFDKWDKILSDMGWYVINPAQSTREYLEITSKKLNECTYEEMINNDFYNILKCGCNTAFLLNRWQESKGARFEQQYFSLINGHLFSENIEGFNILN
jgi:hypothetical protein